MKKVIVGMSGGVDSAVCAYLLKKEGYLVEGLFMRNWDSEMLGEDIQNKTEICPQEIDYNDALEVCKRLDIPLHRVDFVKEYWDNVFKYFLDELKKGRTPNPDLLCNKYIKFDVFKKEAKKLGADYIATGHYAKINNGKLLKAVDSNKDQTYFLADVPKENFSNVLFPLGNYLKSEVREIAKEVNLNVATKKDSTGICFIGERNFQKFIKNFLQENIGDIIDVETNKKIAEHKGLMNYTIGQRKNVGLSGYQDKYFVCGKNVSKNVLYVTNNEKFLISDSCVIDNINFLTDERPTECSAKFRYRSEEIEVNLEYISNDSIRVSYAGAKSITPGQACVLYLNDVCLGCGFIKEVYKDNNKLWYL